MIDKNHHGIGIELAILPNITVNLFFREHLIRIFHEKAHQHDFF